MFEASSYDKYVAERCQLFLMFGMGHGEEVSRENALRVMFRPIVYRCHCREVVESAATILVSVLPFHSNGSFEEYVALILAYLNTGEEVKAALQMRIGHNSLLEDVRDAAKVRLDIVIRALFRKEGGLQLLEALGLSAHEAVFNKAVVKPLLREPLTEADRPSNLSTEKVIDPALVRFVEVRALVSWIKSRIESFDMSPSTFQTLCESVNRLAMLITQVEMTLGKLVSGMPAEIYDLSDETLSLVHASLMTSVSNMKRIFPKAFPGNRSLVSRLRSKVYRVTRFRVLANTMNTVEMRIDEASTKVEHLCVTLRNALFIPKLEDLSVTQASEDVYRPNTSTPALSHVVVLDFDSMDHRVDHVSPEVRLKHSVLSSDSSHILTAATGVMNPTIGVVGMVGVGKTVALQGLGHDEDVRIRFPDGVHYMTFGWGATVLTAIREIAKIMASSGAIISVQNVKRATTLREAVDYAIPWFEGKICLFLIDDLWPSSTCKTGFLTELRQILRGSPESRMAISTRSTTIAQCAGNVVNFRARDPLGSASMKIFMAHATSGSSDGACANLGSEARNSVLKILKICAGLPIALAVTGSAVSFLARRYGDFEIACESYATRLEKKRVILGDADTLEGTSLNAGILLSLEYLEVEFLKWKAKRSQVMDYCVSDLYTSLCVLEHQAWVSVSVLGRLWRIEENAATDVMNLFCGMSLATFHWRQASSEPGIALHNLQLDFCKRQAMVANTSRFWHAQMLSAYLETRNSPAEGPDILLITSFMPRPWWSSIVPEDGYIHANLCRHLSRSGNCIELAALLLDSRWTEMRSKIGGILALKSDFKILDDALCSRGQEPLSGDERRGFDLIFKSVRLSWRRLSEGLRVFHFHTCERLVSLRKSNAIVDAFVKSVNKYTPKPFLFPVSPFFPELDSAPILEIPVGGICRSVTCSPCGQYMAAGAGSDILVTKSSTGEILQHLRGHTEEVSCIVFASGSKHLFSGSGDKTVIVWEWELSGSPVQVLKGYDSGVSHVAVTGDGGRIFSSSWDKTLWVWDAATGTQECALPQTNEIACVAFCEEGRKIALGLEGGTLKILDSVTKDVLFEHTEPHEDDVLCVSFSPTGLHLATGLRDKTVHVWNTETWTRAHGSLKGHESLVKCVAFSADGKQIVSGSNDGTIRLWDVESGSCVGISPKISSFVTSVSFIGDGKRIVSGSTDGIARIWDARLGTKAQEHIYAHSAGVDAVAITQNGLQVASASLDGTVRLWDTRTGEQIGVPMEGHTHYVTCVAFSPDGRRVVSGSDDSTLRLWDTETQTQIGGPFEGHARFVQSASFSFDGLRIVSGSNDETVRIWNAETLEQIGEALEGHQKSVFCVLESADGCHIVSRDDAGQTIIWNRESRAILWKSEEKSFENEITDDEAEQIICSCDVQTPHLWPKSFPEYASELCYADGETYSNLLGGKLLLADLDVVDWKYHTHRKLFAVGLGSGAVAICKLITA